MKNNPYLLVINDKDDRSEDFEKKLNLVINIHGGQDINLNFYYGFRQLTEVAIKALSPGINDPGTAILSLQALGDLLAYRLTHYPEPYLKTRRTPCVSFVKREVLMIFSENAFCLFGTMERMTGWYSRKCSIY